MSLLFCCMCQTNAAAAKTLRYILLGGGVTAQAGHERVGADIVREGIMRRSIQAGMAGLVCVLAACASAPAAGVAPVPKGYVIAEISVTNPEPYKAYVAAVTPMVAAFGGRYLVRGGAAEGREGAPPEGRIVVLEFPSLEAARAFNDSPEYAAIARLRQENAESRLMIVEGTAP